MTDTENKPDSEQIEKGLTKARDRFLKKYLPKGGSSVAVGATAPDKSVERPLRTSSSARVAPEPDMGPDLGDEDGDYFSGSTE